MWCDAEDADAPRRVLDHGQDVGLGAVEQVDREEVARQDRLGLRTQELRPGWPGPSRRGAGAAGLEDLLYGRRRDFDSQAGQLVAHNGGSARVLLNLLHHSARRLSTCPMPTIDSMRQAGLEVAVGAANEQSGHCWLDPV
jgi:hypothetical protein